MLAANNIVNKRQVEWQKSIAPVSIYNSLPYTAKKSKSIKYLQLFFEKKYFFTNKNNISRPWQFSRPLAFPYKEIKAGLSKTTFAIAHFKFVMFYYDFQIWHILIRFKCRHPAGRVTFENLDLTNWRRNLKLSM